MGTRVLLAVVALLVLFGAVQAAEYVRRLLACVDSSLSLARVANAHVSPAVARRQVRPHHDGKAPVDHDGGRLTRLHRPVCW